MPPTNLLIIEFLPNVCDPSLRDAVNNDRDRLSRRRRRKRKPGFRAAAAGTLVSIACLTTQAVSSRGAVIFDGSATILTCKEEFQS